MIFKNGQWEISGWKLLKLLGPVTKIENIKTDETKILRPTDFSGSKDIKTDRFFVGLNL
jgi:hypothetical protein